MEVTACSNVGTAGSNLRIETLCDHYWPFCSPIECGASSENCTWAFPNQFLPSCCEFSWHPSARALFQGHVLSVAFSVVGSLLAETVRWRPLLQWETWPLVDYPDPFVLTWLPSVLQLLPVKSYQQQGSVAIPLLSGLPLLPPSALCQDYADFHNLFFFKEEIEWHRACSFLQPIFSPSCMVYSEFTRPRHTVIASSYSTRSSVLYSLCAYWSKKCIWPGWSSAKISWLLYYF